MRQAVTVEQLFCVAVPSVFLGVILCVLFIYIIKNRAIFASGFEYF